MAANFYWDCLAVQDASNYCGVALAFGSAVKAAHSECEWLLQKNVKAQLRYHPVVLWWMSKLNSMSESYPSNDDVLTLSYPALTALGKNPDMVMRSDEHFQIISMYFVRLNEYIAGDTSVILDRSDE